MDTNHDGIGDLRGITQKLDYLRTLGVEILWLSPVYQSPNDDYGCDISDYRNIMTDFGNIADFEYMVAAMHSCGLRLVMDLVVNHTSDEHMWFEASRASKDNSYRDYNYWQPDRNGQHPPHGRVPSAAPRGRSMSERASITSINFPASSRISTG